MKAKVFDGIGLEDDPEGARIATRSSREGESFED
jgi:hypothetical protein